MKGNPEQIVRTTYKLATEGYLYELGVLVKIVKSQAFGTLLPLFSEYEKFVSSGREDLFGADYVQRMFKEKRVIDAADYTTLDVQPFTCANLAACCEIFSGWTIPVGELDITRTDEYLKLALSHAGSDRRSTGRKLAVRLNKGDTARVVHLLKLLGLIPVYTHTCDQLSLCASVGERDRHALHQMPNIIRPSSLPSHGLPRPSPLQFGVKQYSPRSVVMIDKDPALEAVYKKLNHEEKGRLLAMNTDLNAGLEELSKRIRDRQMAARNLIVSFRLEPDAFSEVELFLKSLGRVIAEKADLILTIGAGDDLGEFRRRLKVLDNFDEGLSVRGMSPVRIKASKGKTARQQQSSPIYGLSQYASYETLYCRLDRSRLQ
ncbi:MAG: hypothetical protein WBO34_05065 [Gammaproteobacteria bacterium]